MVKTKFFPCPKVDSTSPSLSWQHEGFSMNQRAAQPVELSKAAPKPVFVLLLLLGKQFLNVFFRFHDYRRHNKY
ncbi:MAG: hypothetical protein JWQ40_777 [Segetibacter sp.]|nr:hypothetical protein [Segetibacter sp.]